MNFSRIAQSIGESATLRLNATAARLRAAGEPIIHLGGGEPKSKAPAEAGDAAIELLKTAEVRYAPAGGLAPMKEAVTRYTQRYYGHECSANEVIISGGAKQAIMVCLQAILDPGDEAIFPVPYWVSYPDMVRLCGATPVPVTPEDGSFQPSLADIEKATTSKTKVILINTPNNPSGEVYSAELIADIVDFCERRGLYLIMDDIYHRLIFDGREPVSAFRLAKQKGDQSKLIVINGVSKAYAMTGYRIGWAVANPALIKVMAMIQGHQTSGTSGAMQLAAAAAIDGDQTCVSDLCKALESNRAVLMEAIAAVPKVDVSPPGGTFYCFADFSSHDKDSTRLAEFLLEKVQVVTVPGIAFGLDGYLRLSTCGSAEDIREGLRRIAWALDPASPNELSIGTKTVVRNW